MNVEQLNRDYAIPGQLAFIAGRGGFPTARIDTGRARATVSVYGAQVLSFQPAGAAQDMLFVSDAAYFAEGKAIKGGIPVCWPWFGTDPENPGRPAHGFVRNRIWTVRAADTTGEGDVRLTLGLSADTATRAGWPGEFDLALSVTVGASLSVELRTRNCGDRPFAITQALHSYFRIGDIHQVRVRGLDSCDYLDKAGDGGRYTQSGDIRFAGEVDRIYLHVPDRLAIEDPALARRIDIITGGSATAVVWNPWAKIAAAMGDLKDDDFRRFVCVETANAATDSIELPARAEHRLRADFRLSAL